MPVDLETKCNLFDRPGTKFRCHARGRRIVECSIGLFKNVWRCTSSEKQLRVKSPEFACRIIKACGLLHNFRIKRRNEHENDNNIYYNDSERDEALDDDNGSEEEGGEDFSRVEYQFKSYCTINSI